MKAGQRCTQPAELLDIYPTLIELASLPKRDDLEGISLAPQLKDAAAKRERPAVTSHNQGNHGVRSENWRYIRYADGTEELYDMVNDRYEIYNQYNDATPAFKTALQGWLSALYACAGSSCQVADGLPAPIWQLQYKRADIDRDGQVGVADIMLVAGCWRQPVTGACGDRNDLDYDGDIDVSDIQRVAASFNAS